MIMVTAYLTQQQLRMKFRLFGTSSPIAMLSSPILGSWILNIFFSKFQVPHLKFNFHENLTERQRYVHTKNCQRIRCVCDEYLFVSCVQ